MKFTKAISFTLALLLCDGVISSLERGDRFVAAVSVFLAVFNFALAFRESK